MYYILSLQRLMELQCVTETFSIFPPSVYSPPFHMVLTVTGRVFILIRQPVPSGTERTDKRWGYRISLNTDDFSD